ncbi:hypothetical protein D3C72_2512620 [compost metagenome]
MLPSPRSRTMVSGGTVVLPSSASAKAADWANPMASAFATVALVASLLKAATKAT